MKRRVFFMLVAALILVIPGTQVFASSLNWRDGLTKYLNYAKLEYEDYNRFTIHDLDGDNVPELLLGKTDENSNKFVSYDVFKYSPTLNWPVLIGNIPSTRYLIKDKYSNSLITLNSGSASASTYLEMNIFYINNSRLQRNSLVKNENFNDGRKVYTENGITVDETAYSYALYDYLGTYDELIVEDRIEESVIMLKLQTWVPNSLTALKNRVILKSNVALSKPWQYAYTDFVQKASYPVPTLDDEYSYAIPYGRYALHDMDNDKIPELFMGVPHGNAFSYDVYKYINGDVKYIGSVQVYANYIAKFPNKKDVFSYMPYEEFYKVEGGYRSYYANGMFSIQQLMEVKATGKNLDVKAYYKTTTEKTTKQKYYDYVLSILKAYAPIKTYDIELVPADVICAMWK